MTTTQNTVRSECTGPRNSKDFLTFTIGGEEFGVETLGEHEIIGMQSIAPVPGIPEFVGGIMELHGHGLPIILLRRKFAIDDTAAPDSCIIVLQVLGSPVGLAVECAGEVLCIRDEDVKSIPMAAGGVGVRADYLLGVAAVNGRARLLVDIERLAAAA